MFLRQYVDITSALQLNRQSNIESDWKVRISVDQFNLTHLVRKHCHLCAFMMHFTNTFKCCFTSVSMDFTRDSSLKISKHNFFLQWIDFLISHTWFSFWCNHSLLRLRFMYLKRKRKKEMFSFDGSYQPIPLFLVSWFIQNWIFSILF